MKAEMVRPCYRQGQTLQAMRGHASTGIARNTRGECRAATATLSRPVVLLGGRPTAAAWRSHVVNGGTALKVGQTGPMAGWLTGRLATASPIAPVRPRG